MLLLLIEVLRALLLSIFYYIPICAKLLLPKYFKKSVKNETVLITGGASGFGKSLAKKFLSLGSNVIIVDVNKSAGNATVSEFHEYLNTLSEAERGFIKFYHADLTKKEAVYSVFSLIQDNDGDVDILINNAGVVSGSSLLDTPDERIQLTFDVNILAHFWTIKALLPTMIQKRKGHIVNVASMAGVVGTNNMVDYCSSKFAAVGLHEALREELLAQQNDFVECTLVCPYYANTGMFAGVKTDVLPLLEAEDVTESILHAVLLEMDTTCIPSYQMFLPLLKFLMPTTVYSNFCQRIGISHSMDQFRGRSNGIKKD
uniref:Short-chain dehydrogenase/reductase 3 n=1 Tax=Caligus clemensi TaxID=344056 RepID=C1C0Z6_CALCM|nr:Epidermal retinal dehydrogenase 2 [Caligus clemensi]